MLGWPSSGLQHLLELPAEVHLLHNVSAPNKLARDENLEDNTQSHSISKNGLQVLKLCSMGSAGCKRSPSPSTTCHTRHGA